MDTFHIPVLTDAVLSFMNLKPNGVYVDCTLGGGGHSLAMLERFPDIRLFCIDQDKMALDYSRERLLAYRDRITYIWDNFRNLRTLLAFEKVNKVDGILMDIGVSNHQLSSADRGFSFMHDSRLDMRMDSRNRLSAFDIVNTYPEDKLVSIFFQYGEDNFSRRIAKNIVRHRELGLIETTGSLCAIIEDSVGKQNVVKSKARIFQALRIEVNHELSSLSLALKDAVSLLHVGGRLVVISWHSLEDRIVKEYFRDESQACICSVDVPICACSHRQRVQLVTKKAVTPSEQEILSNSNSRSARLRVCERI